MNRIQLLNPAQSEGKTKVLFDVVKGKLGKVPNGIRVLANSASALEGYLCLNRALAGGVLPAALREQIALAVGDINACGYCLSLHIHTGGLAGLSPQDIASARFANAANGKADAALKLARSITLQRGQISDADIQAARTAGHSDAEIVEIILHVGLNTITNYINNVARTVIDFPQLEPRGSRETDPATALQEA